mmetsp:Transcript_10048/g.15210  ORF Transcript_10048/g.15210 Transcript_10048/m.15210 type:complete len:277 (+) Transcript_10048:178-1008(+)
MGSGISSKMKNYSLALCNTMFFCKVSNSERGFSDFLPADCVLEVLLESLHVLEKNTLELLFVIPLYKVESVSQSGYVLRLMVSKNLFKPTTLGSCTITFTTYRSEQMSTLINRVSDALIFAKGKAYLSTVSFQYFHSYVLSGATLGIGGWVRKADTFLHGRKLSAEQGVHTIQHLVQCGIESYTAFRFVFNRLFCEQSLGILLQECFNPSQREALANHFKESKLQLSPYSANQHEGLINFTVKAKRRVSASATEDGTENETSECGCCSNASDNACD